MIAYIYIYTYIYIHIYIYTYIYIYIQIYIYIVRAFLYMWRISARQCGGLYRAQYYPSPTKSPSHSQSSTILICVFRYLPFKIAGCAQHVRHYKTLVSPYLDVQPTWPLDDTGWYCLYDWFRPANQCLNRAWGQPQLTHYGEQNLCVISPLRCNCICACHSLQNWVAQNPMPP